MLKRGPSVSDMLLRSLGKCRFLPAASRLDSLKSRKEGQQERLDFKSKLCRSLSRTSKAVTFLCNTSGEQEFP